MRVTVGPPTITINHDRQFVVAHPDGFIRPEDETGFFSHDTRFVSGYKVSLNGLAPVLLNGANVEHFSARHEFTSAMMPVSGGFFGDPDEVSLPAHSIGFRLDRTIREGVHEDYRLVNYASRAGRIVLEISIESDFADIFEVRDHRIVRRGDLQSTWDQRAGELRARYRNASFRRELVVKVQKADSPAQYANGRLVFAVTLKPKQVWHTCLLWLPVIEGRTGRVLDCERILWEQARGDLEQGKLPPVALESKHPTLPAIWRQAVNDMEALRMSAFATSRSVYVPAAGIPWYVTLFGRDALIVSMESISGFPEFAAGALQQLGRFQASDDDAQQDKEPGKILHEIRSGELAELDLLPFAPYYGTHDATPLFLIVLSYAYQWSGDRGLLDRYRDNAERALRWILESGDRDGDGFLEYSTRSRRGLFNQGWKDSGDGILDEHGRIPAVPIALCEHQGYAFDAFERMAEMYELWGDQGRTAEMRQRALTLYQRFNDDFWWESEGTYYLGLDGQKRPLRTVASNAGHCLASGIVPPERAGRVVDRLMADDMFSGWGVRTLSSEHPGYNPYSYHDGSVWPHDNATLAGGFRRAGRHAEAQRIAEGIFAAAEQFDSYRLPELFAGLKREPGAFPVQYLGANVPQAWAAAAVFRLVAILCGIHTTAATKTIYVNPDLPDWLPDLTLRNLRAGAGATSLHLERDQVAVLDNSTGYQIVHGPVPRPEVPKQASRAGLDSTAPSPGEGRTVRA